MYVVLINEDNSLSAPKKERIVQRSKLVNDFWFLVHPNHNDIDMAKCTVLLEYLKPVSKKYKTEILSLSSDKYKEYLKYVLPIDTEFTKEPGDLEIQISFIYVDIDVNGKQIERVRKTAPALKVHITPISAWADVVPDEALSAIDQRIIKTDAQIRALEEMSVLMDMSKADNLKFNTETSELQLMSGEMEIGDKVVIRDNKALDETLKEGIPVVSFGYENDFDTDEPSGDDKDDLNNTVEFGLAKIPELEEDNNVVSF